jgi:hypothetical protein
MYVPDVAVPDAGATACGDTLKVSGLVPLQSVISLPGIQLSVEAVSVPE